MLLPLQGECVQSCCSRGAATLCPGLCARCLSKAHPSYIQRQVLDTLPFRASAYNRVVPGVSLRSAPGYVLAAFSRCIHPMSV